MILSHLSIILITACSLGDSARILGVVPIPSYSHQVVFRPIWRELSRRGHDLVVITTDPENDPNLNIKEIDVSSVYDLWKKHDLIKQIGQFWQSPLKVLKTAINTMRDINLQELSHPEVQAILKNDTEYFDLLIVEYGFPLMFGFAARFKCPYIGVSTMDTVNMYHNLIGNPSHPVLYPDLFLPFEGKLNFWQRLTTTIVSLLMSIFSNIRLLTSTEQQLLEEYFGEGLTYDIGTNVSMLFINVDPSVYVRPLGPATIAIGGGTHLTSLMPLPKDLQEYLDGAKNGVIYFSLGTNVKSQLISPEMRKVMFETFKELPYRVLWKFDITDIPDIPENVKIVEWLPQQDILRHPNIKLFITQGGLQSMEEAIFSNVPVVGIPFISDQHANVQKIVRKGLGVYLDSKDLTKESFKEAILEVINNPKYKQKILEVAELSKDQPMTGLEKAVWWTEYVIRHKGAPHFRNPAMDLPIYQYYFLDIIGFILAINSIFMYISFKVIVFSKNFIVGIFRSNSKNKVKTQ